MAAQAGHSVLLQSGSALDAVEQAVVLLEDDPIFNAGRGSHFNKAGHVEMDALICDGAELNFGAVTAIRNVANPINVARMVLELTEHCMLAGHGATTFAHAGGVPFCRDDELYGMRMPPVPGDTVGAVAMDDEGRIASATSTGGTPDKHPGRVGDSPLNGCGGFADEMCGISATGDGEALMRITFASAAAAALRSGVPIDEAIDLVLNSMKDRIGGEGGAIAIDRTGDFAACWNTAFMPWAAIDAEGQLMGYAAR
jgi:beta-aspartyl-peptidase (threonine type)